MKKQIYFLVSLFALIGFSINVMGQTDNGRTPFIGSKHTYSVTSNLTGSTFAWEVRESSVNGTNVLGASGTKVTGSSTTASIDLTWETVTPGTNYFVIVKETASAANGGCTNTKAFAVIPQNAIELDIVSMEQTAGTYSAKAIGELASSACAADVVVTSWDGGDVTTDANSQNFTYTYGKTYLFYQINARNVGAIGWKPSITLTNTNSTNSKPTLKYGTTAPSGNGDQTGYSTFTNAITIPKGTTTIYIQLEVDNLNSKSSPVGVEGIAAQTWTASLTGTDANNNPVSKINGDTPTTNDKADNQIKARPGTSFISGN